MPRRTFYLLLLAIVGSLVCHARADRQPYGQYLSEILGVIDKNYVEPVDEEHLFEGAVDGMLRRLDKNSAFLTREDLSDLNESLKQEFGGIGIEVTVDPDTHELTVLTPIVDTPAYAAGLRVGDKIAAINGESTKGFSLLDAVRRMRGKTSDQVTLRIARLGVEQPFDVTVARARIASESVRGDRRRADGSWDFQLVEHPKIGSVRITSFGERTAEEVAAALDQLDQSHAKALIVDMRGNPGGLLPAAIGVCELFVNPGVVIVTTRGRGGVIEDEYTANDSGRRCDLPMCVLVDKDSASASEIVAACLQDHNRATIIGERSYGKGTVQKMLDVEGGKSVLKLTTSSYWRPSEKNIHRSETSKESDDWGVRPNSGFEVKLSDDEADRWHELRRNRDILPTSPGEKRPAFLEPKTDDAGKLDPQLSKAVEYLTQQLGDDKKVAADK